MAMTTPDIRYDDPAIATDGLLQQYVAMHGDGWVKKWRPPASIILKSLIKHPFMEDISAFPG